MWHIVFQILWLLPEHLELNFSIYTYIEKRVNDSLILTRFEKRWTRIKRFISGNVLLLSLLISFKEIDLHLQIPFHKPLHNVNYIVPFSFKPRVSLSLSWVING